MQLTNLQENSQISEGLFSYSGNHKILVKYLWRLFGVILEKKMNYVEK